MGNALPRRVYRRELREALGYGETWFAQLQKRGLIPRGRRDPGGRREWWYDHEADAIIRAFTRRANEESTTAAA